MPPIYHTRLACPPCCGRRRSFRRACSTASGSREQIVQAIVRSRPAREREAVPAGQQAGDVVDRAAAGGLPECSPHPVADREHVVEIFGRALAHPAEINEFLAIEGQREEGILVVARNFPRSVMPDQRAGRAGPGWRRSPAGYCRSACSGRESWRTRTRLCRTGRRRGDK